MSYVKKDTFSHTALEGTGIRKMFSQIHHYTVYSAMMPLVTRLVGRESNAPIILPTTLLVLVERSVRSLRVCVSVCLSVCQDNDNF